MVVKPQIPPVNDRQEEAPEYQRQFVQVQAVKEIETTPPEAQMPK